MLQDIVLCCATACLKNWYLGVFASKICLLQMSSVAGINIAMSLDTCSSQRYLSPLCSTVVRIKLKLQPFCPPSGHLSILPSFNHVQGYYLHQLQSHSIVGSTAVLRQLQLQQRITSLACQYLCQAAHLTKPHLHRYVTSHV